MDNAVATIMLFAWVPLAQIFFARLPPHMAAAVIMLGGLMFLPERLEFDLPGLPPFDKRNSISLSMLIGGLYFCRPRLIAAKPGTGFDILVIVMMLGAVATVLTNTDALVYGPRVEAGLGRTDAISMAIQTAINWGLPFFLGRAFFRTTKELRSLAIAIVIAGLIYSLLVLFEARFSPHLHKWTYGYHPARFANMVRGDGWKPMIFMISGLSVGLFMSSSMITAFAVASTRTTIRRIPVVWTLPYFAVIVVLCRSVAPVLYGFTLAPLAYFVPTRQLRAVVLVLAAIVLTYPMTRALDVFPDQIMIDVAKEISEDRSRSLWFRFTNERTLLEKAQERIVFGWGIGGRNRVYDDEGVDRSVTDGFWIIQLGSRGLVGWFCSFGLLLFPTFALCTRLLWIPSGADRRIALGLGLSVLSYSVDLLPNGLWTPLPIFLSGALAGVVGNLRPPRRRRRTSEDLAVEAPPTTASQLFG